eukprot:CAMPEP_0184860200 /NCGR_PEP_ID=MMETSP0580-20130426/5144_1 /TAXON_ID=1118495 /ORGANISM="Dactyliosolen fragilissimus" /LENGTH=464 /DNA_ID=CAMNT_0027357231 /DNA_START=101 /DNA_END=1495 /DNA_ORIENTATION=-
MTSLLRNVLHMTTSSPPSASIRCTTLRQYFSLYNHYPKVLDYNNNTSSYCHKNNARPIIILKRKDHNDKLFFQTIRRIAIGTNVLGAKVGGDDDGDKYHELFQEQMMELERERRDLLGENNFNDNNVSRMASSSSSFNSLLNDNNATDDDNNNNLPWEDEEERRMMLEEREALFQFTNEERNAWGCKGGSSVRITSKDTLPHGNINDANVTRGDSPNYPNGSNTTTSATTLRMHDPGFKEALQKARKEQAKLEEKANLEREELLDAIAEKYGNKDRPDTLNTSKTVVVDADQEAQNHNVFTHLSKDGDSVSMVDVGEKVVTRRMARARSIVVFPPEVMHAFGLIQSNSTQEMIGPKGPILATAKLAGIMGAKRTSDLIPLCHPLPLDKVNIDITLEGNKAIIICECRVTHKTGVEMEALAGASIAALTIYDMVKAVSHDVKIESTGLLSKSGGKRDITYEENKK